MSASRTSTGGFTALPNVDAEINLVAGIALSVEAHPNTLIQGGATNKEMAQALKSVDIVHTACHGVQNAVDPLRSAFHLNDNRKLTVSDLKHARLAFLSARETAKGDRKKPNQVIHLAATMLFVGFKSDVGTVWAMNDEHGPKIAEVFYGQLFESKAVSTDAISRALDYAVRQLRSNGASADRWATFMHLGA